MCIVTPEWVEWIWQIFVWLCLLHASYLQFHAMKWGLGFSWWWEMFRLPLNGNSEFWITTCIVDVDHTFTWFGSFWFHLLTFVDLHVVKSRQRFENKNYDEVKSTSSSDSPDRIVLETSTWGIIYDIFCMCIILLNIWDRGVLAIPVTTSQSHHMFGVSISFNFTFHCPRVGDIPKKILRVSKQRCPLQEFAGNQFHLNSLKQWKLVRESLVQSWVTNLVQSTNMQISMKELPGIFAYKLAAQRQWDGTGEASDVPRQGGDVWELCLVSLGPWWMDEICL